MSDTEHPEALAFAASIATRNFFEILKGDVCMVSVDINYVLIRFWISGGPV